MLIPRTRGAVSGVLLILLGAFGALIPLIGPSFDFTIGSANTWDLTDGHVYLSVLPGIAVAVGGLLLLLSANRATAGFGGWLALLGGIWFVIGEQISRLWNDGTSIAGSALGSSGKQVAEQLVYYGGLGVLITAIAGVALGRLAVRSVRDAELAAAVAAEHDHEDDALADDDVRTRRTRESGRFDREREPVGATAATTATSATTAPPTATDGERTDTLSAADRVRLAAGDDDTAVRTRRSGGLRGLLSRRR